MTPADLLTLIVLTSISLRLFLMDKESFHTTNFVVLGAAVLLCILLQVRRITRRDPNLNVAAKGPSLGSKPPGPGGDLKNSPIPPQGPHGPLHTDYAKGEVNRKEANQYRHNLR